MTEVRRLIATDIDGTLLGPDKRITARTRDAFQLVHGMGEIDIALVSSRMPTSLARIESALNVPCWKIAYDGVLIEGPARSSRVLRRAGAIDSVELMQIFSDHSLAYVGVYAGEAWLCNAENEWSKREAFNTEVSPIVVSDIVEALMRSEYEIHKIMFRDVEPKIAEMRSRLAQCHFQTARWFSNGPTIVEIVPRAASKALALDFLVEHLGIVPERVTVFGDGANDIPMFERYLDTVAVENAIPDLKQRARHSTFRGDEDGVARFLLKEVGRLSQG